MQALSSSFNLTKFGLYLNLMWFLEIIIKRISLPKLYKISLKCISLVSTVLSLRFGINIFIWTRLTEKYFIGPRPKKKFVWSGSFFKSNIAK